MKVDDCGEAVLGPIRCGGDGPTVLYQAARLRAQLALISPVGEKRTDRARHGFFVGLAEQPVLPMHDRLPHTALGYGDDRRRASICLEWGQSKRLEPRGVC